VSSLFPKYFWAKVCYSDFKIYKNNIMSSLKAVSRLALLREEIKLTQLELAQLLDITENTIANWERGRGGIEWFVRIAKLCQIFQCLPEDLFEYVEVDKSPEVNSEREVNLERLRLSLEITKQEKIVTKTFSTGVEV